MFGKKLQEYAQGTSAPCQHPINQIDDNNYCHACDTQLVVMAHVDKDDRIAALEAQNKKLVEALTAIVTTTNVRIDDPRIRHFDTARALLAEVTQ